MYTWDSFMLKNEFELPDEWERLEEKLCLKFDLELKKELCATHPLYGINCKCIAKRINRDDFLFQLIDTDLQYAVVHLTWSVETEPDWPWTTLFKDLNDFKVNWKRIQE